jgi:hypothetical protein
LANSILEQVDNIQEWVKACLKDELLAGFDVLASKHKGRSYVIAKRRNSFRVAYIYTTTLDSLDPFERSVIFNAIHVGMYGRSMDVDALNNEMICRSMVSE